MREVARGSIELPCRNRPDRRFWNDGMKDIDGYIDTASALIDLEIAEAHRPGVRSFLQIAADMAATVEAAPLAEDELALAPVYLPPERSS